jgi:enamine deaminase RidA (YjgF/YER057c/UK114 family)
MKLIAALGLILGTQTLATNGSAQQLEYFGKPVRNIPVSSVVKAGKLIFVSGTPGFKDGKIATGDFAAQIKQAMDNVADALKSAGAGFDRVVKTNVILVRREDFGEMNRIYGGYFSEGKYPARTTTIVAGLPSADFLVEVECEAVLE